MKEKEKQHRKCINYDLRIPKLDKDKGSRQKSSHPTQKISVVKMKKERMKFKLIDTSIISRIFVFFKKISRQEWNQRDCLVYTFTFIRFSSRLTENSTDDQAAWTSSFIKAFPPIPSLTFLSFLPFYFISHLLDFLCGLKGHDFGRKSVLSLFIWSDSSSWFISLIKSDSYSISFHFILK